MRQALLALGVVALVVVVVIGANQAGDGGGTGATAAKPAGPLTLAQVSRPLANAPPKLAALHDRVNELAPGGKRALDAALRDLRGHPVVVNLWASWCGPCRHELPFFQRQAVKRGAQIAFVGVNSNDSADNARRLAAEYPMPYPSFVDPRLSVAGGYGARGLPVTAFYDAAGKRVLVHQGGFTSEAQLAEEIDRYALGRG